MTLFCKNGRSDSLVLEGRLRGGECVAVSVEDGVIARIEPAAALVTEQVRAGLVVRMAVLSDLMTVAPSPALVTAGVA